jgi:hypothetical protein
LTAAPAPIRARKHRLPRWLERVAPPDDELDAARVTGRLVQVLGVAGRDERVGEAVHERERCAHVRDQLDRRRGASEAARDAHVHLMRGEGTAERRLREDR